MRIIDFIEHRQVIQAILKHFPRYLWGACLRS
jgi:hypothetical protein